MKENEPPFRIGFSALAALFLLLLTDVTAQAVEPWADSRLPVRDGLELWLDVSRQTAARAAHGLPPLPGGRAADYLLDGSGQGVRLSQRIAEARPRFHAVAEIGFLRFDGKDDALAASDLRRALTNATVFLVAAPRSNAGFFRGFYALSQAGRNDYTSGLNLDLGPNATPRLSVLNVESAGSIGARNLLPNLVFSFGTWHTFTLTTTAGPGGTQLFVDGHAQGTRERAASVVRMDELTLGARYYSNGAETPFTQGFLDFDFAEMMAFNRVLSREERAAVEKYLAEKYAALRSLPPTAADDGSVPLQTVTNAPPVQMFVPGFAVQELPIALNNINNVKYRPDGTLVALGYDGHVHLLSDSDGDGLEDKAAPFWDKDTLRAPIGMALTPPGYARGQGVFVTAKGKVSLIVDTDGDDRADEEIIVARWEEPSVQHGVDGLGVALDREGHVYFSLGTASFTGAYLLDTAGQSRYRLDSERGTILKVSPDFQRREIVCTGIRFAVALAFNRDGELFCTDQEGATWLPNGNPLDELLHIQPGRHYGFPPRHPRHLPNVIDEPSVFDYGPQHQSTCGLNFNDPVNGGPTFGPPRWSGDALVAGYSRGKLYRTKLVHTPAGYVAQNQLIACLDALTVDACVSPRGDLIVATHSGTPDWGSGPTGPGKLYRLRHAETNLPQPVLAWSASPTELRIAFDRPLAPEHLRNLARQTTITQGREVFAGDRFETLRPGYQVVQDQMGAPRFPVTVLSAGISADHRAIILTTPPRRAAVNYAITLPSSLTGVARPTGARELPSHRTIDLVSDLTGVEAHWQTADGQTNWSGWLPHLDLKVARAFTVGSADHDALWRLVQTPGTLVLRGQLDLWQMLQAAVQPGAKLDHEPPTEEVTIRFATDATGGARFENGAEKAFERDGARFTIKPRENRWVPFQLRLQTKEAAPSVRVSWTTAFDPKTARALPLRRLLVPWATPRLDAPSPSSARQIPELAGGHWLRGQRLFFGETAACSKCHQVRGRGNKVGPDLSNLVHRDYASVLKDLRDPNAAINPDHVAYNVELNDGDALTAVLQSDGPDRFTFADASGRIVAVPKASVKSIKASSLSLMPEGIDQALSAVQLKDLMTFLLTSPLEPAALEIKGEPPPRRRAEVEAMLQSSDAAEGVPTEFRILLCAGPKDHGPGEHDYPLWQKRWATLLALADKVTVDTAQVWPTPEQMRRANVIVFYSNNPGWNVEHARELDAFFERGGGAVYLHYAVDGQKHVEELARRIGLAWRGGFSKFRHGPLNLQLHDHPLARGLERASFVDESYWKLVGETKDVTLLASGPEEGAAQPLLWTRQQGKGRVFVSIPGHYTWTFDDPLFRLLILRGICWTGGQPMDRLSELSTIGARMNE